MASSWVCCVASLKLLRLYLLTRVRGANIPAVNKYLLKLNKCKKKFSINLNIPTRIEFKRFLNNLNLELKVFEKLKLK